MYQFILLIHVFAAVCVIALVLVQQGKGATMGAAFGSGASQTVFGSRGSGSFLFRITISFIAVFFITSIGLNYLAMRAYKTEKIITLPATPVRQEPVSTATQPAVNTTAPAAPVKLPERK
jgi:preprotein translocase subunit SecG